MRGRPPKDEAEKKGKTFRFRVTDEERVAIDAAADSTGQTASEWARTVLLKAANYVAQRPMKRRSND